jgi:hypothetical protein
MPDERPQDPILDEVRRNRDALVRASGGSLEGLFSMLKAYEARDAARVVKLPPRRPDAQGPGPSASDAA